MPKSTVPNFLPEQKHTHFVVILSVLIVIILAFLVYVIYMYKATPEMTRVEQTIPLIEQRVTLTPEESTAKQAIIEGTDRSQVKLTKKQQEEKLLQIKQAQEVRN